MILRVKNPRHLIIGNGEIGKSIKALLEEKSQEHKVIDKGLTAGGHFDIVHVCFPHSKEFEKACTEYADKYLAKGGLVMIHSTIPVGTTRRLGPDFVHTPCRGVHPDLLPGLKTFVKFFGGHRAREAAAFCGRVLGLAVSFSSRSENTEAMKLWETEQYKRFIETMREIKEYCEDLDLDFDMVYTEANHTYNEGYAQLGMDHVTRPVLFFMPGPTGGHCVDPNHKLLFPDKK